MDAAPPTPRSVEVSVVPPVVGARPSTRVGPTASPVFQPKSRKGGARAGAGRGACSGSPMDFRNARTTRGWVMTEMTRARPPHPQARTFMANTRSISSAQVRRDDRLLGADSGVHSEVVG